MLADFVYDSKAGGPHLHISPKNRVPHISLLRCGFAGCRQSPMKDQIPEQRAVAADSRANTHDTPPPCAQGLDALLHPVEPSSASVHDDRLPLHLQPLPVLLRVVPQFLQLGEDEVDLIQSLIHSCATVAPRGRALLRPVNICISALRRATSPGSILPPT